jgi:hypothetical protein
MIALALGIFVAGCGGGVEIPPVEIGGSGARLMTGGGRTPEEVYENAYAQLTKQHLNVRRALEPRGRNLYGASLSMQSILDAFVTMRSVTVAAQQSKFDAEIVQYETWKRDIDRDTWGGSFLSDFDRAERRVKEKFDPAKAELLASLPSAPAAKEAAPAPAVKTAEPATTTLIPPDKTPTAKPAPAPENPAPKAPEKAPDAPPAPAPAASGRLFYKAWIASHEELVAAYKTSPRPDCRTRYEDVIESLKLMKGTLPADRAPKLQIYMDFYGGLNEKTKTFSALPEKTTEKDVLNELDVISQVIRREFNPDK